MSADHDQIRVLLGAYLLGGLSETDRRMFESHLPDCDGCRSELARSAAIPGLLRRAPGEAGNPPGWTAGGGSGPDSRSGGGPGLDRLLEDVRRARNVRRRRARLPWLAAASSVAAAGVAIAWFAAVRGPGPAADEPEPGRIAGPVRTFDAAAGRNVSGRATLTAKPWGTSLAVSLAGLPSEGPFVLRVVSDEGTAEAAATWGTTPNAGAKVTGASSMDLSDIDAVLVLNRDGDVLAVSPGG